MPKYCVVGFQGAGTDDNPYRPLGVDSIIGWSIIDFRPDSTVVDGFCIAAYPDDAKLPKTALQIAGYKTDTLSFTIKNLFQNKINLNVDSTNFDELLLELLTTHATPPGDKTRWNPLMYTKEKHFEIWLGAKIVDIPFIAGGATYTESFNKADGGGWGPDLTWAAKAGGIKTVTSTGTNGTTNSYCLACTTASACSTNDTYTQAVIVNTTATSSAMWGVVCRYTDTSGIGDGYEGRQGDATTQANTNLNKLVSGTRTQLSTSTHTLVAADAIKVSANGSTITLSFNGVSNIGLTDTSVTTGVHAMAGIRQSGTTSTGLDSLEYGDLVVNATASPSVIARSFAISTPAVNSQPIAVVINRPLVMNSPTVLASSTIAPSTIARSITMPAPTVAGGSGAYPTEIATSMSFPAPTVTGTSISYDNPLDHAQLSSTKRRGSTVGKPKTR